MSELADRLVGCVDNGYGPNLDLIAKVVDTLREQDAEIKRLREEVENAYYEGWNDASSIDNGIDEDDKCWAISDAKKALEDVVVGENLFHEASLQSAVKSLIDTVEKSRNDQGGGK